MGAGVAGAGVGDVGSGVDVDCVDGGVAVPVSGGGGDGELEGMPGYGVSEGIVVVVVDVVVVGAEPDARIGGGDVVGGDVDVVEAGFGVGVDGSGTIRATAAGGAAAGDTLPSRIGKPPLPFVPGGTGPGADGVGMTPVRYARAHCNTMST